METETCFTCHCEQGRYCHEIGAGYAIETCNPLRLCDASAVIYEVTAVSRISFTTMAAMASRPTKTGVAKQLPAGRRVSPHTK